MSSLIEPVRLPEAAVDAKALLESIHTGLGMIPNSLAVLAHHPPGLAAILAVQQALQEALPGKLRELASLKAAAQNDCYYSLHDHRTKARRQGITEDQITAIVGGREAAADFSDLERLVLLFAGQLTRTAEVDAAILQELRQSLTSQQFIVLALTVGAANMFHRLNFACHVELP